MIEKIPNSTAWCAARTFLSITYNSVYIINVCKENRIDSGKPTNCTRKVDAIEISTMRLDFNIELLLCC